jgi:lysophospholipase L1-like esterase
VLYAAGAAWLALAVGACSSPTTPTPPPAAPALTCPADLSAVSNDGSAVVVSYVTPEAAGGSAPVTVSCRPPSGSLFSPGATSVACTATDQLSRQATCTFLVKLSVPPRLKYTKFMAFGDSMTAGKPGTLFAFGVEDYAGSYPSDLYTALVARYATQTFTMSKQGWPGEYTAVAVPRLQSTLPTAAPQVVLLMDGANDLAAGDSTAIQPAVRNMQQMVALSQSAGAQVFLANLPPTVEDGNPPRGNGGHYLVETYNSGLAGVANQTGATLVDVYTALKADPGTFISADGLHPSTAGYQKIADTFLASIRAKLEITGVTPAARSQGLPAWSGDAESAGRLPLLIPAASALPARSPGAR